MPTGDTVRVHAYPRRRGLTAALVALALALLTGVPLGSVYADEPPSPSPTNPAPVSPEPTAPAPETAPAPPADEAPTEVPYADRVEAVVAIARAQVGKPYRIGSEGPDIFDCSGLVYRAFTDAGEGNRIGVARMRAAGYMRWFAARELLTTNLEDAERGDLVI